MNHPFLADPARAQAYRILCDCPSGTTRSWAEQIGWTQSKLVRFLAALKRHGLGEVVGLGRYGSLFRTESHRTAPSRIVPHRSGLYLDASRSGLTASRYGEPPEGEKQQQQPDEPTASGDEGLLIRAVNEVMKYRFTDNYKPISEDNRGSVKAARAILDTGATVDDAVILLRRQAMAYTPDKTGGDLPRSLGHKFLGPAVIRMYRLQERERQQLPLIPSIDMHIERAPVVATVTEPDRPKASDESITAGMEEMKRLWASE